MHGYDENRPLSSYYVGEHVWANRALVSDLWFWYAYLRTGRADLTLLTLDPAAQKSPQRPSDTWRAPAPARTGSLRATG